uniref:Uncharacterized protein n=1 Tax=Arundo donax TaxID=35708 RepID=A0A0A9C443_ARUDO
MMFWRTTSRTQMRIGKKVMPMFVLRFRFWTQRFLRRRALACVKKLAGPLEESMGRRVAGRLGLERRPPQGR